MFKPFRLLSCLLLICVVLSVLAGCQEPPAGTPEPVDYAASVTLDMSSDTAKQTVSVRSYIDGDTTHFAVPTSLSPSGVLKARYLAINTPESTGKIEEYGKAASNFTKEKLSGATSILVESDDGNWNLDSTGGRYLVWVWYRTGDGQPWRNLNIEILQYGLAIASSSANNRYGDVCTSAIAQAKEQKLSLYSGQRDPDFYYGEAVELTLRELRCNVADYNGVKVAFEGVVTVNDDNSVYVEDYDPETGLYFGMAVYYGFSLNGDALEIISVGNRARIVGTVQYYETGGTYQVSGLYYRPMKPDDPNNLRLISTGIRAAYQPTTAEDFTSRKIEIESGDEKLTFDYAALAIDTSISMTGLRVVYAYTTTSESSSSRGAITLTCKSGDITVYVRLVPMLGDDGKLITEDAYLYNTVSVQGIVGYYNGDYQINVFTREDIQVQK